MEPLFKAMAVYYAAVNILLFALMGIDKVRAKRGQWRIREATLAAFSLLGGGVGGFAGMRLFHHKTKKWYFYAVFAIGIILHVIIVRCAVTKI